MKLVYVSTARLPTEKAHGLQIMKMCEAFADQGYEVELVVPRRYTPINKDPFVYYGVKRNFTIKTLPVFGSPRWGPWGFRLMVITFSEVLGWWLLLFRRGALIYTRDDVPVLESALMGRAVFWEVHKARWNIAARIVAKRAKGLIAITSGVKQFYTAKGIPTEKITVAPDGVDLSRFTDIKKKSEVRTQLNLSQQKYLAVYTGHLYSWKGADTLAQAAAYLPEGFKVVFVGGTDADVKAFRGKYGEQANVRIVGHRPHDEMPDWLAAADILVLPNTARDDISKHYTSPMKLFEYMAAKRPIIASDLPSIREVLSDTNAYLVQPDEPQALANAMLEVRNKKQDAAAKADRARNDVAKYTWRQRAESITQFLEAKDL